MFITGHYIEENHWYRNEDEGTRICGNLGHWLDLSIHLIKLKQINLTDLEINITYSDIKATSENLSVTITTPDNDMIVIIFSTRGEPFEGVSETINFQQGDIIATNSSVMWKDDLKIILKESLLSSDQNEINLSGSILIELKDVSDFYTSFQVKKKVEKI